MALNDQLAHGLERLAAIARRADWSAGEAEGLTPTQAEILRFLSLRSRGARLTAAAEHCGVSQPTASDAVAALVRKGLVEKTADPADGRAVVLLITRAGTAVVGRHASGFEAVVRAMSEADRVALHGVVMRTILSLQQAGQIPAQRMCLTCRYFDKDAHPGADAPHHCRLVDAPLRLADLRTDCPEHEAAGAG